MTPETLAQPGRWYRRHEHGESPKRSGGGGEPSPWWTDAVVYQVYVRSFADSDGDGIGDLQGIIDRIGSVAELGVDAIWLNPCYPSPQRDHGYDVADYLSIEPAYGSLDTFDALVAAARDCGLRLMMDIVPNHCSDEHPWFRAAVTSLPGSVARDRFYFRDGKGGDHDRPPNNWTAVFGGSAWTRVSDGDPQWYLGIFSPYQPDLDHTHPDVVAHFDDVLHFWLDRGVAGFRVDAPAPIAKAPGLPDAPPVADDDAASGLPERNPKVMFRPEGHRVWRHWRAVLDDYAAGHPGLDPTMVAEVYTPRRSDLLSQYLAADEFHQAFAFDLLLTGWYAPDIRAAITDALEVAATTQTPPTWALNNHDTTRIVSRLGRDGATAADSWTPDNVYDLAAVDLEAGTRRSRAAVCLALGLPGSMYLYQGEELGLPEVLDIPADDRKDPNYLLSAGAELGRDGCRVPLPWNDDPTTAYGFSTGGGVTPWLPQPADWGRWSVDRQLGDVSSMRSLYRTALAARREWCEGRTATVAHDDSFDRRLVAIERGRLTIVCNTGPDEVALPYAREEVRVVLDSGTAPSDGSRIAGDTTIWLISG